MLLFWHFQILTDLVQGEFMQLGSKESENERFAHYLTKTYRKTASLIANTTKSVRKWTPHHGFFNKKISFNFYSAFPFVCMIVLGGNARWCR